MILFNERKLTNITGAQNTDRITDGDPNTLATITSATLVFTLASIQIINRFFLQSENISAITLEGSTNNSSFVTMLNNVSVPNDGVLYQEITNTTAYRYYRLTLSGSGTRRIARVYLMNEELDLRDWQPNVQFNQQTTGVTRFELYDGEEVSVEVNPRNKTELNCEFVYTPIVPISKLRNLWLSQKEIIVYPILSYMSARIYRCVFDNNFRPTLEGPALRNGSQLKLKFVEV